MLGYKVFQAGVQGLAVQALCMDAGTGIVAGGSTQGTATPLTNAVNFISAGGGGGVILSSNATAGDSQIVFNGNSGGTGNEVKIYPPVGSKINGLATNAAVILGPNTACEFHCGSTTQWAAILSS